MLFKMRLRSRVDLAVRMRNGPWKCGDQRRETILCSTHLLKVKKGKTADNLSARGGEHFSRSAESGDLIGN